MVDPVPETSNLQEQSNVPAVYRVGIKLPPFWPDKPAVWFAQVEAQFELANITRDQTKFNYVVSQLDGQYAGEVDDIITKPPAADRYEKLKYELIHRLGLSEEQRVRQLLMSEELGDRKPSQFLRHMRSLAGSTPIQDSLVRTLWLQRLPHQAQAILQTQNTLSLDQIAEIADRIVEVSSPPLLPSSVHAASASPVTDISMLSQRIEELSRQVAKLTARHGDSTATRYRARKRSFSRGVSVARDSTQRDVKNDLCWYHRRFGDQAQKCTTPCNFQPGNANGSS